MRENMKSVLQKVYEIALLYYFFLTIQIFTGYYFQNKYGKEQ